MADTLLTFSVTINDLGNADKQDKNAALGIVRQYNAWRAEQEPPLPALPESPNAALLESYRQSLEEWTLPNAHNSYREQANNVTGNIVGHASSQDATESEQDQVDAILGQYYPDP